MNQLKTCFTCGKDLGELKSGKLSRKHRRRWFVICRRCGSFVPATLTREAAIRAWNRPVRANEHRMGIRFCVHPGWVRSAYDRDRHFIGANDLARLYGVRIGTFVTCYSDYSPAQVRIHHELYPNAKCLRPNSGGNYTWIEE